MIDAFRESGKVACFLAVRPSFSLHLVDMDRSGKVNGLHPTQDANLWINGGFFIFRSQIFDYLQEGEELVEAPFRRLIETDQLLAFKHEGFWRPMDTLKDKEVLEDMVEQGSMPWRLGRYDADHRAGREPQDGMTPARLFLKEDKSCACWSLGIWVTWEPLWCRCCSSQAMRSSVLTAISMRVARLLRAAYHGGAAYS